MGRNSQGKFRLLYLITSKSAVIINNDLSGMVNKPKIQLP